MIDYQGNPDFTPIDQSPSESRTLHLPQIAEPVSVQKFLDRLMQYQVDPALVGRQIYQILATNIDREILLLQIANTLGVACGADFCLIAVADQKVVIPNACWLQRSDRPNAADATQTPEDSQSTKLESPSISIEHPVFANVLAEGEIVAISDYLDTPGAASSPNSPVTPLPCRAVLAAPARFGGAVNGTIVLGKWQPHEWSATDGQRLEAASEAIGIAIAHIQKTQEIARLNQQLQRQAKYKNLLRSVATAIDTSSEVDRILQQLIENTVNTLEVDRGQILLFKHTDSPLTKASINQTPKSKIVLVGESASTKNESKLAIEQKNSGKQSSKAKPKTQAKSANSKSKSSNSKQNNSPAFWLSESNLCSQAFHSAPQPFAFADASELIDKEQEGAAEILKLQGIRALLVIPIMDASRQETVLGFLVLQHSEPRPWNPEELEILESVCAQASRAIVQTQTLKELQSQVQKRDAELEQSINVQEKLHEQSANLLEQIRRLKLIKDEFIDNVSHELRTPLTIMNLAILMLKKAEQPSASRANYLDILEQHCAKEAALVQDLLTFKQFERQPLPLYPVNIDLNLLIKDLVVDFEKKWADKGLTLEVDVPKLTPSLETDPDSLKRVLLELLTNAGKYSASETTVVFEVSEVASDIVLSVSNFGRGIIAADLPHIFDKFRRGTGITNKVIPGTGLGLALVKSLVQHMNGTIDVSSCPAESSESDELCCTSFTLTLPKNPAELLNLE
ncbi:MAG: GAF domain-containing protein [Microcoleus sp. PH2017_10_PVI_O_A]|uniref:sensor histidine kinase n=1 Tax=unclassified Microcoleus TaxID=2642155 RepID=UPI001D517DBD|nr:MULTISPECIES: GAF domain-containing protein [unclassified Microcoleus]TAE76927.1 MAG: GAF domain-containing protein [Oscillatoriales cyanobacterium]MCC3405676.1 GAF domain-containing protein [Microcoleus sp. PH2017_10_PVI_O_A]MCC3463400.1 GAF domain-containing protein [Microcoleus sp. PH2017_11_PCY_U_A]MCC3478141.1 GAF domain-containing protein [Microcoleus sp. PH2017_12_PCY_D_A]MCC3528132.1 GAF domain-containing protein [Microcoleus sp. PH2017_21_RUC_O_A]